MAEENKNGFRINKASNISELSKKYYALDKIRKVITFLKVKSYLDTTHSSLETYFRSHHPLFSIPFKHFQLLFRVKEFAETEHYLTLEVRYAEKQS